MRRQLARPPPGAHLIVDEIADIWVSSGGSLSGMQNSTLPSLRHDASRGNLSFSIGQRAAIEPSAGLPSYPPPGPRPPQPTAATIVNVISARTMAVAIVSRPAVEQADTRSRSPARRPARSRLPSLTGT